MVQNVPSLTPQLKKLNIARFQVVRQFEGCVPAAAEAAIDLEAFAARLKPRPFKTNSNCTTPLPFKTNSN
jgi:hypothetical protein